MAYPDMDNVLIGLIVVVLLLVVYYYYYHYKPAAEGFSNLRKTVTTTQSRLGQIYVMMLQRRLWSTLPPDVRIPLEQILSLHDSSNYTPEATEGTHPNATQPPNMSGYRYFKVTVPIDFPPPNNVWTRYPVLESKPSGKFWIKKPKVVSYPSAEPTSAPVTQADYDNGWGIYQSTPW